MTKYPFIPFWIAVVLMAIVPEALSARRTAQLLTTTTEGMSLAPSQVVLHKSSAPLSGLSLSLDASREFQTMDGFGAAITYSTAYNLLKMSPANRRAFLEETYSDRKGYGFSYARISIGCSDFSSTEYTCCDKPGLENFSLHSDEINYVIPVLKEILAIHPKLKIIGSPWTCPRWMKVKNLQTMEPFESWTDGQINPKYYNDYARYFVLWIRAFEAAGIPIYAVTPQNEPLNRGNCASTYVSWQEEGELLKAMGAEFKRQGLKTRIYAFDHNYNYDDIVTQQTYPVKVYNMLNGAEGAEYVVGAAYHNYGGSPEELDKIHAAQPDKSLIFSEASIGTWNKGRDLKASLLRDVEQIALGTVNRWCTAVVVWNLMLDDRRGPNLDGGCQTCYGAVDVDSRDYKTIRKNSHYYTIAHLSAVVKPGACRIALGGNAVGQKGLTCAAFRNPDKTKAVVLCNRNPQPLTVTIQDGNSRFECSLPASGVVSCRF